MRSPFRVFRFVTLLALLLAFCGLGAHAQTGNALDRIDFGSPASEAAHNFNPGGGTPGMAGKGAYGQTYRSIWGSSGTVTSGNQQLTFTVKCDPALQNYLTIKLWGNDNPQCYIYIQGQDNADSTGTPLDETNGALPCPDRFYYVSQPLPLGMTQGLTSVQVTLTANAPAGQPDRNIYSAFSHTATRFEPDPKDATGYKPAQSGYIAPTSAFTATQIYAQLLADRQAVYGTSGTYNKILSQQVPPGTSGAPPEVIGLCVNSAAQLQSAIANNATPEQWRNDVYNGVGGLGYSHLPEPLWWLLGESYLLPPYVDQNGNTVSGLDHYHDSTILQRYISALDGASYQQDQDGGFGQNYGEWMGLCSTPRDSTSAWPGSTARQEWSISFEGAGIYAMAYNFVRLLHDPTAGPLLQQYLGQSYDADFSGTPTLRAYAYERMFHNFSMFAFNQMNGQTVPSASTVSQINYQQSGAYACQVANEYLQSLYPNSNYVFAESEEMNELNGALGLIPSGPGGTNTNYPNYEIDSAGLGEAEGTQSGGYDGRYGEILPQMAERWAMMAPLDSGITDPNEVSAVQRVARNTVDAFSHFESPGENAYWDYTTGLFHDDYHFDQEDFITYRDPYNINSDGGWWTFEDYVYDADPSSPVLSTVALRSLYLAMLYGQFWAPANAQQIDYTESALKSLIGVDPSTIPAMQGEPGQPNSAWADVQLGDVAAYYNGERLYINSDYRGSATPNYLARYHDTVGAIDRAGFVFMPHNSTTVQSDDNVSGDYAHPWFDRIGPWLCAFNRTGAPISVTLPAGTGSAVELISGVIYPMGASVPLAANTAAVFALPGAGSSSSGTSPLLADGFYTLSNIGSGLPAEDQANGLANGSTVDQAAGTGLSGQKWQLTNVGNNVVRLSNAYSLLSLDAASAASGAPIILNSYNYATSQNSQLWTIASSGSGYTLTNTVSGLVLEVPGGSSASGTALDQAAATGASSQQWQLTPTSLLPNGVYSVVGAATGLVWDAFGPGSDYARTITNVPTGGASQRWNLVNYPNGNISLSDQANGQTTQIIFGTSTPGGQVAIYPATAWWYVTNYGQGRVGLTYATGLGLPLEDDSTSSSPGVIITQQAPTGSFNQQWTFATAAAISQSVTTVQGQPVGITLSGTDLNTPAQPLTYAVTTPPAHGALTGTAPNLIYTPAAGFVGTDSFVFTAGDSGPAAPATVTVTVQPTGTFSAADGSFEAPSVGAGAYQYRPTGGPWAFTGDAGIQSNGSAWSAPAAPDGTQTAFLQGNGSNGVASQAVNFATTGAFRVSFQAARRGGQVQPVQVSVDGVAVGGPVTPAGNTFQPYNSATFTISTAGSHTLSFAATDSTGDKTTFVDLVQVTAIPSPTVAAVASATPNPVTGTTTQISVLGADAGGEGSLTYAWSATGPAPVTFSASGTNAAKTSVATFTQAGAYTLTATIANAAGGTATSSVAVTVNKTLTGIAVSPMTVQMSPGGTQQFTAVAYDQFGNALSPQPTFTWAKTGYGTLSSTGLFTAGAGAGSASITAASGGVTSPAATASTPVVQINAGGPAVAPFAADTDFVGGSVGSNGNIVSTAGVVNPAPMAVYQTERYGSFNYVVPNMTPGASYTVRLHFAEIYWSSAGKRIENVSINGSRVLSNFDVFAAAGGENQALIETFTAAADSSGRITIAVSPVSGSPDQNAEIKGLEVLGTTASLPPTVATTASATPNPVTNMTTNVSVLGGDGSGESVLTYTWSATGPAPVTFSAGGTNAAKNATATFTQPGTYTLTATIADPNGVTAPSSVTVVVYRKAPVPMIMPLGDSITKGALDSGSGYRDEVYQDCTNAGVPIQFVGATSINASSLLTSAGEQYHNGYGSYRIDDLRANLDGIRQPGNADDDMGGYWLTGGNTTGSVLNRPAVNPQVVLLMAGTNDVEQGTSLSTMESRLTDLLTWFQTSRPSAQVYVAQITPLYNTSQETLVQQYNQWIGATVPSQFGGNFHVVNMYSLFVDASGNPKQPSSPDGIYLQDGVHPSHNGYVAMGDLWFNAIKSQITPNVAPTVASAASATPNPVTGTTTQISVLGADAGGEGSLTYAWSATGPAAVTFSASGTNAAKSATATFSKAGAYTLKATITDAGGLSTTSGVAVTVSQTLTAVAVSPATATVVVGQTQPFTATATDQFGQALSPQPAFTWAATGAGAVNNTGLFTGVTAGPASVTAASGPVTGPAAAVTVTAAASATALSSSLNPSTVGQSVTFTATVTGSSPTGTVTFTVDGTAQPAAALSGGAAALTTTSLSVGPHQVSASYSGGGTNAASVSGTLTQTVTAAATATALSSSANPAASGRSVTFTATVTGTGAGPTGTVMFTDGTTSLGTGTLAGGVATLSTSALAVGSHSVTASYGGDGANAASKSAALAQAVAAAPADISAQVLVQRAGTVYHSGTRQYTQPVRLTNTGKAATPGPVYLVLDGLSGAPVLVNRTGVTALTAPAGHPYLLVSSGGLKPGVGVVVTLTFSAQPSYTTRVLAGPGTP